MPRFHQILYVSQLAQAQGYDAFTAICRMARQRNPTLSISGVLLFDGHRFCQSLRGPATAVMTMMQSILRDLRHERVQMLAEDAADASTAPTSWACGYCDPHELDVFDAADGLRGTAAMSALERILSRADLAF